MKTFEIEITETLQRVERVEAENSTDAVNKAIASYKNEEIVLTADDYVTTDISLFSDA